METKTLYAKLYKIQQLALAVSKDGKNPHFKSAYPTLDNVIEVLTPELNKNGILITHFADQDVFVTRVVDVESGEFQDSRYTMLGTTPQQRGSEQTYFRRYSMIALFNLPSEDDDGNIASNNPSQNYATPIQATGPSEWMNKSELEQLFKEMHEGVITAGSSNELVKIARTKWKVSKAMEAEIVTRYQKEFI